MSDHLPDHFSPISFARAGKSIQQRLNLEAMERAQSMLADNQGSVSIDIQFSMDEAEIPLLQGTLQATVNLPCQRCMERVEVTLESRFDMALIQHEQEEETLPEQYEPLLIDDHDFSLHEFIEDELILAIPVVVSHEPDQCNATQFLQDSTELPEEQRQNPFQILEQLKH